GEYPRHDPTPRLRGPRTGRARQRGAPADRGPRTGRPSPVRAPPRPRVPVPQPPPVGRGPPTRGRGGARPGGRTDECVEQRRWRQDLAGAPGVGRPRPVGGPPG